LQEAKGICNANQLRIAQKFSIPKETTVLTNKDNTNRLEMGGGKTPAKVARNKTSSNEQLYTIKSGDTVETIARDLEVEKADFTKLNNLNNKSTLQERKKLLVPDKKVTSSPKNSPSNEDFFESFDEIAVMEIKNESVAISSINCKKILPISASVKLAGLSCHLPYY
jgi:LysM repeat protein